MRVKKNRGSKVLALCMAVSLATPTSLLAQGTVFAEEEQITETEEKQIETKNIVEQNKEGLQRVQGVSIEETEDTVSISWEKVDVADGYKLQKAVSKYADYETIETVDADTLTISVPQGEDKYANYYKVIAIRGEEEGEPSESVSLETTLFGEQTIIFSPTDDIKKIDEKIQEIFDQQNDMEKDAQFKGKQYQIYFKPGDYTETQCMNLGFYTIFSGLGETPYDVKLNNISIPNYLADNNATCNFWRGAENLSVIATGNEQGKARDGSWRPDSLNWAVAQAAPLRRIYSERPIAYDWNYGWASGGYVADSYINASSDAAGTWSGQQFYTRNSIITGNVYGTTLNQFFQGVEADNLPGNEEWEDLQSGKGYTNWSVPKAVDDGTFDQQVVTSIENTEKISEKPFLYLDDQGEYQVFVPDVTENAKGISWSEEDMGKGTSIALSEFYIANPKDSAKKINEQIAKGKNIYFTPGTYYAEEPIVVSEDNVILLGTGMASIVPENRDMALKLEDVEGVRVAGLILDAGKQSNYLMVVGSEGTHVDHSDNPVVLQDLFFRVGGTTDSLTKADDALEINSDDVICDHFWIWRADHGAGVEWYGNESKHGLIVNGDDVICYALFNEHFQEYSTLWNGENGKTYFYQNETCYDPISQEAWMSHNDTVNGYAAYKVSNDVENHYAVGLGIYNVFINTGEKRDAKEVQIQLDNAIEVPNSTNVVIENACLQTFANENGAMQKINHIINGVGAGVSSGVDIETGEKGDGWSRTFLLSYKDGTAILGKTPSSTEKCKFIGLDTIENIAEVADEEIDSLQAIMKVPEKLENKENNEFSTSIMIGSLVTDLKMVDAMITMDSNLSVKDVVLNENITGGTLNWNVEEGEEQNILRIVYSDFTNYQTLTTTEEMPCDLLQITYVLKNPVTEVEEDTKLTLTLESLKQYTDADTATEFVEKPICKSILLIEEGTEAVSCKVLYVGDGSDFIPNGMKAVKVNFTGALDTENSNMVFQAEEMDEKVALYYSKDFSERDHQNTYIMLVPDEIREDALSAADYYHAEGEAQDSLTFGDVNQDDMIDAQDALKMVRFWLRSDEAEEGDAFILRNNVTGDSKINNADALAIVEKFVADKAWGILRMN